ncbi:MAG: hypothetical protein WCN98_14190 [Verrucomicrobiaceae bacterium]
MAKATNKPKTEQKTMRNRSYEEMGSLIRRFLDGGSDEIHTNRTIARHMFGVDHDRVTEFHIRKARAMVDKMVKLGLPLCSCGADGVLQDKAEADREARRGMPRCYRFDPYGSTLSDALREAMGQVPRIVLAVGIIALESAVIDAGCEEAGILLDAARGAIALEELTEAERELAIRRRVSSPSTIRPAPP